MVASSLIAQNALSAIPGFETDDDPGFPLYTPVRGRTSAFGGPNSHLLSQSQGSPVQRSRPSRSLVEVRFPSVTLLSCLFRTVVKKKTIRTKGPFLGSRIRNLLRFLA